MPRLLSQVASKSRTNKRSNWDSLKRLNEQRLRELRAIGRATKRDHLEADIRHFTNRLLSQSLNEKEALKQKKYVVKTEIVIIIFLHLVPLHQIHPRWCTANVDCLKE